MMRDGGHLALYDNHDALRREIARHSKRDAEAYDRYVRDMLRHCRFIKPLLCASRPTRRRSSRATCMELLYLGKHFHKLGEARMYDTLRFWTMSCADFLDEYFESEIVKAHLAGSSIIGTALGPRSPGTAYVLLHHYMGEHRRDRRRLGLRARRHGRCHPGAGGVAAGQRRRRSAASAPRRADPRRATAARVGVALADGEEISAQHRGLEHGRASAPSWRRWTRRTCRDEFVEQVRNFKIRGSSGKLNIALDGLPDFPGDPGGLAEHPRATCTSPTRIEMMERAYDDWKDGRWSRAPYVDMLIPSQIDPTMAPDGKHYMSVFVQYCPYQLADGPVGRGRTQGVRRHRHRHHCAPQPGLQGA